MITLPVLAALFVVAGARTKAPLMDDSTRTRNKAAECVFGKQVRELGSQWIPDLGVPIGVLYCMKCECVPLQKKRRIVARVQCRSIKNECPEPKCEEPVHIQGRCCKTCPGDTYDSDIIQDIVPQNVLDDEEKSSTKHYAALLTERSSLVLRNDFIKLTSNNLNKNNVVATGRFTFHKKNLYYSFYISDKAARPRSLQFVDSEGNILEEFILSRSGGLVNSLYQNATRKVCGVWRRIPHEYRKRFRQEKMYVVLVWGVKEQAEFTLSGQVMKHAALSTENFSSLLEPAGGTSSTMAGAGGTAIVSISSSVSTSIYLAIIFNGLFSVDEIADVPINVSLSLDDKKYIIQEVVRVKKPHYELNMVEVRSPVTPADLRLLTRGRLILTVSSVSKPETLRLSGNVVTKVTCELFQTTLAPSASDPNGYGTSGLAWLYLNNEGSLVYNIQIDNLRSTPDNTTMITLVDVSTKRRTELEDLTPSFDFVGWANGTVAKLSPKVLEPLYSGNLAVNVATTNDTSLIRGRLVPKPVADARDAPAPFLMKRENYTLPASAVGMAWLYVDNDCCIHYDVSLSGLGSNDRKLELYLELLPMLAPGAPVIMRHLDDFQGNQVEGSPVNSLTREEINRLDSGVGFLKVKEKETKITLLVATIRHVVSPPSCQLPSPDNDVHSIVEEQEVGSSGDCLYEGKFYQEETQWISNVNPCTMCFCQNGVPKCFTMECPEVTCPPHMKLAEAPGECCPICMNATTQVETNGNVPQKCIFNGQPYSPGSQFHPFLIPTGFDSCTLCACDPIYLEIKCTRISNEKECCKNCAKVDYSVNGTFPADDGSQTLLHGVVPRPPTSSETSQQVLAEGGCQNLYDPKKPYANGSVYHPSIDSLGEYKCVTCKCENGKSTCWRECDRAMCEKKFQLGKRRRQGEDVRRNNAHYCCTFKECKKYRHRKNHNRVQKS